MKVLILPFGNLGTTKKVAEDLALLFTGKDMQIECVKNITKPINYKLYDIVIFGSNVRAGRFNKSMKEQLKIFKQSESKAKAYAYVVGANKSKAKVYEDKVSKLVGGKAFYVGGELPKECGNRLERAVISSLSRYYLKRNIQVEIDKSKLDEIVKEIQAYNKLD